MRRLFALFPKILSKIFRRGNRSKQSNALEQDTLKQDFSKQDFFEQDSLKALANKPLLEQSQGFEEASDFSSAFSDNSVDNLDTYSLTTNKVSVALNEVSDVAIQKAEQSFDIVSNQVTKLVNVSQGLAKHSRRLGMFSAVSALWLWFYSFRGLIANWSWLTNISLIVLFIFLVPSLLVFGLYFILRQSANLPNSFLEMKEDLLNGDDGALSLFAQKSSKHTMLASWKVFGVIRNFRELLKTFPTLFSQYKSVISLSNPLIAMLLGGSVIACVLVNGLALLTFFIALARRL